MKHVIRIICSVPALILVAVSAAWFQAAPDFTSRLTSLEPSNPRAYFELAEEIAEVAQTDEQRELAEHLFALAAVLDPRTFGRSSCLGLAQIEKDPAAKRRLLALASLLDPSRFSSVPVSAIEAERRTEASAAAIMGATEALSRYRKGQGALALTAAKRPGVMEVLETARAAIPGGLARFLEDCKLYKGQTRPPLSEDEINALLRLEAALLAQANRTWDGELLLSGGQPLVEVDPDRLEESLDVDATRNVYRDGRWVKP